MRLIVITDSGGLTPSGLERRSASRTYPAKRHLIWRRPCRLRSNRSGKVTEGVDAQAEANGKRVVRREVLVDVHSAMLASASTIFPGSLAIPAVYWWTADRVGLGIGMVAGLLISLPIARYLRGLDVRSHPNPQRALTLSNAGGNGVWSLLPILMMPDQPEHQYLVLALPFAMLVTNVAATAANRRVYLAGQLPLLIGAIVAFAFFTDGATRWAAAVIAVTALTLDGLATTWRTTAYRNAELQQNNDRLVDDLASANMVLKHRSEHDDLTGLFNRRALIEHIDALGPSSDLAVMLIDLDNFKGVNDARGHQFGDEILRLVSTRMRSAIGNAKVGRLGGDEFVVVWDQNPGIDDLQKIAAQVNRQLRSPFVLDGVKIRISASIGVSVGGGSGDAAEVLERADLALYRAKDLGRDQTVIEDPVGVGESSVGTLPPSHTAPTD